MSKFKLEIFTDGDAFQGVEGWLELEVARMLREAADQVEASRAGLFLRDTNGNTVGSFWLED